MTDATEAHAAVSDPGYRSQVDILMRTVAGDVSGETESGKTQDQWRKRGILASNVIREEGAAEGTTWLDIFAYQVLSSNVALKLPLTDQQIKDQISAVWDDVAGVSGMDKRKEVAP